MSQPKTFFECLSADYREELRKRGVPIPARPPRVPTTPAPVVLKKDAAPAPAPAPTTPSPTPVPSTTPPSRSAIDLLKREVEDLVRKGAGPWDAWHMVTQAHPELVQASRQIPLTTAIEAPTERQQAHQLLKSVTAGLVKDGVAPNTVEAIKYLAAEAPAYLAMIRRGEVPR